MVPLCLAICAGLACRLQMETGDERWLKTFGALSAALILFAHWTGPFQWPELVRAGFAMLLGAMVILFLSAGIALLFRGKREALRVSFWWGLTCYGLLWLLTL